MGALRPEIFEIIEVCWHILASVIFNIRAIAAEVPDILTSFLES